MLKLYSSKRETVYQAGLLMASRVCLSSANQYQACLVQGFQLGRIKFLYVKRPYVLQVLKRSQNAQCLVAISLRYYMSPYWKKVTQNIFSFLFSFLQRIEATFFPSVIFRYSHIFPSRHNLGHTQRFHNSWFYLTDFFQF